MIRGSTYSAVMHVGIALLILFGLPSLTFLLPIWDKEEVPVRVVVMSDKEADEISKKQAKPQEPSDAKKAAATDDQSEDVTSDQKKTDRSQISPEKDAQDKDPSDRSAVIAQVTESPADGLAEKPAAINKQEDEKPSPKKLQEKPKPPEPKKRGKLTSLLTSVPMRKERTEKQPRATLARMTPLPSIVVGRSSKMGSAIQQSRGN